ncbi:Na+/H+ antiporter [Heyndrickxia ginsengihumi]|uniref:Sodium:proton antiporter n=1 Tax=Heyndrickxia ginsengihumi TaxID=363870 RepID=A0A0A6XVU2_9BACI|nr:Na+/H+ antiporter [Heyndrickxia ginsengihumi]KHD84272.1 sodium:proton antiporter [Heyndrickxia ginsengihumi]MBE6183612.1 Na+/H+ antiporter [Bacillus sp. (in: firmicutes)]MCM3023055.1 Na+/H+ antiporter [Heyndrickxia ginsengihumi]
MDIFLVVLLLLIIIGLSNIINHLIPFIPVPIVQIVLGFILAAIPLGIHIPMESDLFLLLFIAPLLFNDGKSVSREALWELRVPILLLALGLVFVTVFAIGYLIHWMIPTIPLPAAFALAAILSPTDVVAVSAMSTRVNMPKGVMHLLEGEGLMNDASGLVAFKFAVTATVTGVFSLLDASVSFLMISIGGFVGGVVLAFLIIRFRIMIRRLGMEDVTFHMLIQILTPFVIYLTIEHLHLSGILGVVAAGIVHAIEREREKSPTVELQVVSKSTWSVILYILNGLVFVLLGLQIPSVVNQIFADPHFNNGQVIMYIIMITAALLLLRFIWISMSWWIGWKLKNQQILKPALRPIGITTISGVRGAVTLAGAFSIPLLLANGQPFPERALIIFIAAGVILVSLIVASIFLPIIAKSEVDIVETNKVVIEKEALIRTKEAAIHAVKEVIDDDNQSAALAVISNYNQQINQLKYATNEEAAKFKNLENDIRVKAYEAESAYIANLAKEKKIDKETAYLFQEYIRRKEMAVTNQMRFRAFILWNLIEISFIRLFKVFISRRKALRECRISKQKEMINIKIAMAEAAIKELKNIVDPDYKHVAYLIIGEYYKLLTHLKLYKNEAASKQFVHMERELQDKAFQAERDAVQKMYEQKQITIEILRTLRRKINMREAHWMEENQLQD